MIEPKLTKRQEKFVELVNDPTIKTHKEAAIKAGYNPNTANEIAYENFNKPHLVERIEKRKAEMAQYANVHADLVFGGTALRASASLDDALDEQGRFDIVKARETGVIHQIKRITRTPNKYGETISVELYGKDSAQDKLGSYLGLEQSPRTNANDLDDIAAKLTANLQALGWSDAKIAELTKRPIASLVGAQELGEAD